MGNIQTIFGKQNAKKFKDGTNWEAQEFSIEINFRIDFEQLISNEKKLITTFLFVCYCCDYCLLAVN